MLQFLGLQKFIDKLKHVLLQTGFSFSEIPTNCHPDALALEIIRIHSIPTYQVTEAPEGIIQDI